MHRRDLLKSLASGAGLVSVRTDSFPAQRANPVGTKMSAGPFIEARDGVSLFYKDWGAGRPVVFVAPWALNSDWWEYQMTYLAGQGLRCIGYDRRGHGRSSQPGHGYNFDILADDLAALIRQLDLRDVTLIGHAMGCGEIVRYLTRHGAHRVARVALVATITPFLLKTEDNPDGVVDSHSLEEARAALSRDRPHSLSSGWAAFFGPANPVSADMIEWGRRLILQSSLKAMLDLHRVYPETDFRPELPAITVPTLIIHGDSDLFSPIDSTGRKTARLIRSSQLKIYKGAAHGLLITHMDQLNLDLLAFVKE